MCNRHSWHHKNSQCHHQQQHHHHHHRSFFIVHHSSFVIHHSSCNFKFKFILHACGQPVLGARTWKELVKISYKVLVVLHWVRPEEKITKSSVKCVHNSMLDARVCQSSVCRCLVYDWNFNFQSFRGCPATRAPAGFQCRALGTHLPGSKLAMYNPNFQYDSKQRCDHNFTWCSLTIVWTFMFHSCKISCHGRDQSR